MSKREKLYAEKDVKEAMKLMFQRGVHWLENHNPDTDPGWGSIITKVISDCMPDSFNTQKDCGDTQEREFTEYQVRESIEIATEYASAGGALDPDARLMVMREHNRRANEDIRDVRP